MHNGTHLRPRVYPLYVWPEICPSSLACVSRSTYFWQTIDLGFMRLGSLRTIDSVVDLGPAHSRHHQSRVAATGVHVQPLDGRGREGQTCPDVNELFGDLSSRPIKYRLGMSRPEVNGCSVNRCLHFVHTSPRVSGINVFVSVVQMPNHVGRSEATSIAPRAREGADWTCAKASTSKQSAFRSRPQRCGT